MKNSKKKIRPAKFWPVMGFATLAGMRSMSAPAFLSHYFSRQPHAGLDGSMLQFMQKPLTAKALKVMAAGEMVADKLPTTPDRIAPPVLLGRLLSGALVGVGEDALVVAGGAALLRGLQPAHGEWRPM